MRKIRCDGRPEGCSPCAQNHTPCTTTDRITGRPTVRGQTEALEAENKYLHEQVQALAQQLKDNGIEPRITPMYPSWAASSASPQVATETLAWPDAALRCSTSTLAAFPAEPAHQEPLPQFKPGSVGDNYLGVSSKESSLSNIRGPTLSVLGATIDITDYIEDEADYDSSVMSYQHYRRVIMGEETIEPAPLPPYKELAYYANWFFRGLNPYTMLVDKRTFMNLIWRIGHEPGFEPTPADTVNVHMLLATIKYQIAVRNQHTDRKLMEEAHRHYRYSLSFYRHLIHGHSWQDVQAMAMICHHMRNFPKPGAAWFMVSTTFLIAIELGFHRSTKAWDGSADMDPLEIEMRKRVFWTLHALVVTLCGKLGRPLPISTEDIDVEFPDPIDDSLPEENTLSPFRKCSFQVGIQCAKYSVWQSKLYRTVYAVRQSPSEYEAAVRRLEEGIRKWRQDIPPELRDPAIADNNNFIFALYLQFWELEFQLLLHHPAVCLSSDPEFKNANITKCLSAAQEMLHNCTKMIELKSIDIPWINTVVYIAAIFTTLFVYQRRKEQVRLSEMESLRMAMDKWIEVMGVCGQLLCKFTTQTFYWSNWVVVGTGDKLKLAMQRIINRSLDTINESIAKRTATESLASAALQATQTSHAPPPTIGLSNEPRYEQYRDATTSNETALNSSNAVYEGVSTTPSYSFGNGSLIPPTFEHNTYTASDGSPLAPTPAAALAAAASGASQQRRRSYAYGTAPAGHVDAYASNGTTSTDWTQWSRANVPQSGALAEFSGAVNPVPPLNGREGNIHGPSHTVTGTLDGSTVHNTGFQSYGQWPDIVFSTETKTHGGQP